MRKKHDKDDPAIAAAQARIQRERNVREATASVELEGGTFSAKDNAEMEAYIRGELTIDDVLTRLHAQYAKRKA